MLSVFKNSWALLLGMMLLMVGNGLQSTLLGVRGGIEQFLPFEMSLIMSAYFVGFLGASRMVPSLIRRVGHVRVFAALASFISAVLVILEAMRYLSSFRFSFPCHLRRSFCRSARHPLLKPPTQCR